jgi:hypothetical protein
MSRMWVRSDSPRCQLIPPRSLRHLEGGSAAWGSATPAAMTGGRGRASSITSLPAHWHFHPDPNTGEINDESDETHSCLARSRGAPSRGGIRAGTRRSNGMPAWAWLTCASTCTFAACFGPGKPWVVSTRHFMTQASRSTCAATRTRPRCGKRCDGEFAFVLPSLRSGMGSFPSRWAASKL